ncbi:MAG: adenylate/guanylate cyclase domain-containing protein, partial [Actinomycetota bacterium]|nr:adenylate/guanylate cyclase domain-containing protein [Actinomycetota bacterium]
VESAEAAGLPPLRAGVAYGPAVNRWGDWYGSTVNLASRLTARARPATVLVSEPVRDAVGEDFEWSFAGTKRLKGFSAPVKAHRPRRLRP